MKSFESLSYGGQIKRLRQLAKEALLNYDLEITEITTLDHGENTSFKVKTKTDKISKNSSESYHRANESVSRLNNCLTKQVFTICYFTLDIIKN